MRFPKKTTARVAARVMPNPSVNLTRNSVPPRLLCRLVYVRLRSRVVNLFHAGYLKR
jgi:hypothetical protein